MKKDKIINDVKTSIVEKSFDEAVFIDFNRMFIITCLKTLGCFIIFLFLAFLLRNSVNKLAIISPKVYLFTLSIFIILLVGIILLLYFDKRKNYQGLKAKYRFYQSYDIMSFVLEMLVILYFVVMFVVTPAKVSGNSMNDTYQNGDNVLVWHLLYEAQNNDVVIIDTTNQKYIVDKDTDFIIKRVVAISGDKVKYLSGNLVVNDQVIGPIRAVDYPNLFVDSITNESYYPTDASDDPNLFPDVIIPEGYIIVLGDNRLSSYDSTEFGLVDERDVLGKCVLRIYPNFGFPKQNLK